MGIRKKNSIDENIRKIQEDDSVEKYISNNLNEESAEQVVDIARTLAECGLNVVAEKLYLGVQRYRNK